MATNKKLSATIIIGGAVASSLKTSIGSTKSALVDLGRTVKQLSKQQGELGDAIKKMDGAGAGVDAMKRRYASLGEQIEQAKRAQDRLTAAAERSAKLNKIGGTMMKGGAYATAAGAAIVGTTIMPGLKEAKHWQGEQAKIAALGMGEETNREAAEFARHMKTFGTSRTENLTLVRDALSVFGDIHHAQMVAPTLAKMKFGNAAVYGEHGADNEAKFLDMLKVIELRGGLKSQADFNSQANMVQKVISATGGRVGPDEWRHLIATGGLAAKSMRDDAFFYQLEPLVQEMGGDRVGTGLMSGYSALYQGRTTKRAVQNLEKLGLIGDRSKVQQDKAGQIAHLDVGAVKGAELFRKSQYEWMKQVLLPTLAEKGITSKDQVLDAIGSIFSSRKGADIMAAMFLQQQQIDKSEKVNRGAADINALDAEGRATAAGKEIEAEKKLADLKLQLGQNILPIYTSALETANDALRTLNEFTEKHPTLANAMAIGIGGVGIALVALGPIITAAGGLLTVYAAAQLRAAAQAAAATTAIGAETVALEANTVAARTGAGALAMWAKRAAMIVGLANVGDMIAGGFGVGSKPIDQKQDDANWKRMNWWQKGESGTLRAIEGTGRVLGMSNIANSAQADRIQAETDYLNKHAPPAPAQAKPSVTVNDHTTNTFHITQQPNQDGGALARQVIDEYERKKRAQGGAALFDLPRGY